MIRIVSHHEPVFQPLLRSLVERATGVPPQVETSAREIIRSVRNHGDEAIRELTLKFERRELGALELPRSEWESAPSQVDPLVMRAMEHAVRRVRAFTSASDTLPSSWRSREGRG